MTQGRGGGCGEGVEEGQWKGWRWWGGGGGESGRRVRGVGGGGGGGVGFFFQAEDGIRDVRT